MDSSICKDAAPVERGNAAAAHHGVEALKKKEVRRLTQRKIDWILSRRKRPPYSSPDEFPSLCNPGPGYSQAEADDFREMLLGWNESREALWKEMSELQQWVRTEYAAKGFVEVDQDHCLFHSCDLELHDPQEDNAGGEEDNAEEEDYDEEEDYGVEGNAEDDYPEEDNAEEYYAEEDSAEEEHATTI